MLTIRLQRTGKKNAADFRIVLAEKESHVSKKINEILGSYNPRKKAFQVKEQRIQYWIGQHVALSPTIHNLFVKNGLLNATKVKAFSTPKKEQPVPEAAPNKAVETPIEVAEATAEMKQAVTVAETSDSTPAQEQTAE